MNVDIQNGNKEKTEILDTSKTEVNEIKKESLPKISNFDFLKISPENRLQYITKPENKSEKLKESDILNFNFHFDGYFNRELWKKTTAGQVLLPDVREVSYKGEIYKRGNLKGEFFSIDGSRLIINQGTQVKIEKKLDKEGVEKLQKQNENNYKKQLESYTNNKNEDIIRESLYRGVDIDFALKTFSSKLEGLQNEDRKVTLEDLFTEFDRIKGGFGLEVKENNKYNDNFILRLLKKVYPGEYQEKSKDFGIKEKKLQSFNNAKHSANYLSLSQKEKILARAPKYVKDLVKKYFPAEEFENALLVCNGESSFNKKAINYNKDGKNSVDRGLFQINDYWHKNKYVGKDIFDPEVNVQVAVKVFKEAGNSWRPWYAAKKIGLA